MKPYIITSDPGIDDLVALMLLTKLTYGQSHCLVSSFGNAPVDVTGKNAQEFISFVVPQWSYYQGASKPLNGTVEYPWPDYFHGPDGVWGIHPKVSTKHVKSVKNYPTYDTLISLSPMTDALKMFECGNLKNVTIMGGAFTVPGNETPYAETNIAFDADSAAHFFKACRGAHVRVVPLDMTREVFWALETVQSIPETSPQSIWIKQVLLAWFNNYSHEREKDFNLHDPLAVYLTIFPEKATWISSGINVTVEGKKRGQTIAEMKNPLCEIAWKLSDPEGVAKNMFRLLFL